MVPNLHLICRCRLIQVRVLGLGILLLDLLLDLLLGKFIYHIILLGRRNVPPLVFDPTLRNILDCPDIIPISIIPRICRGIEISISHLLHLSTPKIKLEVAECHLRFPIGRSILGLFRLLRPLSLKILSKLRLLCPRQI